MKADKLATQQSLAKTKGELASAKTAYPLVTKTIVDLQEKVTKLQNGVKAIDELAKELGLRVQDLIKKQVDRDNKSVA